MFVTMVMLTQAELLRQGLSPPDNWTKEGKERLMPEKQSPAPFTKFAVQILFSQKRG